MQAARPVRKDTVRVIDVKRVLQPKENTARVVPGGPDTGAMNGENFIANNWEKSRLGQIKGE